jgi:hypothetical protein
MFEMEIDSNSPSKNRLLNSINLVNIHLFKQKNFIFFQFFLFKFHFSDRFDKIFMTFGAIFAIAAGAITPISNILLGNVLGALTKYSNYGKNVSSINFSRKWYVSTEI